MSNIRLGLDVAPTVNQHNYLSFLWPCGFFALIGSLFAGIGVLIWQNEAEFQRRALSSKGEVVSLTPARSGSGSSSSTVYRPVVRYILPDGTIREIESSVGTNPSRFQVGDAVEVLYDPNNVTDARLKADMDFPIIQIVFMGMGSIFVLIGGGLIVAGFYIKS